jgi:hypothetical protein
VEFARQPSSQNAAALQAVRRAMAAFASLVGGRFALGEFRRHLVLSKLVEGAKMLAVGMEGIRRHT